MILHIDLDAFFAMLEVRKNPELKGKPVIVGGLGKRGVVSTASYEARVYGVGSALPMVTAKRLCPNGVFLSGDGSYYGKASKQIMRILYNYTPYLQPVSVDEAYLDVSGVVKLFGSPYEIAKKIRKEILEEMELPSSIGISSIKRIAKMASEHAKPKIKDKKIWEGKGIVEVPLGKEIEFLRPLNIAEIPGVGKKSNEKFEKAGVKTIGQAIDMELIELEKIVGIAAASNLKNLFAGEKSNVKNTGKGDTKLKFNFAPKSLSHEETFEEDVFTKEELSHHIVRLSDKVMRRLRATGHKASRISLKLRYSKGFKTITRNVTLESPVDSALFISKKAKELLTKEVLVGGVRLIGVGVSVLEAQQDFGEDFDGGGIQDELFDDTSYIQRWETIERFVDDIRDKFEEDSIKLGSSLFRSSVRAKNL